jgi:hypothetical protein
MDRASGRPPKSAGAEGAAMSRRTLHNICGCAVLFATMFYVHVFHHFFVVERPPMTAVTILTMILAAGIGILSFTGVYLLFAAGRTPKP